MATVSSLKDEMHIADCSELDTLKSEADAFVATYPHLVSYANSHWYREYNRRKYYNCGGTSMITPFDAGFIPVTYFLTLQDEGRILLEGGGSILLE